MFYVQIAIKLIIILLIITFSLSVLCSYYLAEIGMHCEYGIYRLTESC